MVLRYQGKGNKKTISRSKTRKIIAIIKKCKENEVRAFSKGSNPHSKLEDKDRLFPAFKETRALVIKRKRGRMKKIKKNKSFKNIYTGVK